MSHLAQEQDTTSMMAAVFQRRIDLLCSLQCVFMRNFNIVDIADAVVRSDARVVVIGNVLARRLVLSAKKVVPFEPE